MTEDDERVFELDPEVRRELEWHQRERDREAEMLLQSAVEHRGSAVRDLAVAASWEEDLRREARATSLAIAVGPSLRRIDALIDDVDRGASIELRKLEHVVHELSGVANKNSIDAPLPELASEPDRCLLVAIARWCLQVLGEDEPPHYLAPRDSGFDEVRRTLDNDEHLGEARSTLEDRRAYEVLKKEFLIEIEQAPREALGRQLRVARNSLATLRGHAAKFSSLCVGNGGEPRRGEEIAEEAYEVIAQRAAELCSVAAATLEMPMPSFTTSASSGRLEAACDWYEKVLNDLEIRQRRGRDTGSDPSTATFGRDLIFHLDRETLAITYGDARVRVVEVVPCGGTKWAILFVLREIRGTATPIHEIAVMVDKLLAQLEAHRSRLQQGRPRDEDSDELLEGDELFSGIQIKSRRGPTPRAFSTMPVIEAKKAIEQALRFGAPKGGKAWRARWITWTEADLHFDC